MSAGNQVGKSGAVSSEADYAKAIVSALLAGRKVENLSDSAHSVYRSALQRVPSHIRNALLPVLEYVKEKQPFLSSITELKTSLQFSLLKINWLKLGLAELGMECRGYLQFSSAIDSMLAMLGSFGDDAPASFVCYAATLNASFRKMVLGLTNMLHLPYVLTHSNSIYELMVVSDGAGPSEIANRVQYLAFVVFHSHRDLHASIELLASYEEMRGLKMGTLRLPIPILGAKGEVPIGKAIASSATAAAPGKQPTPSNGAKPEAKAEVPIGKTSAYSTPPSPKNKKVASAAADHAPPTPSQGQKDDSKGYMTVAKAPRAFPLSTSSQGTSNQVSLGEVTTSSTAAAVAASVVNG